MNKHFICNCLPIILLLLNLVEINNMMKNKKIIRISVFLFGIIGGFVLYYNRIGYQSIFEWVSIYITQFYFYEFISVKSNEYFSRKFNTDKTEITGKCNETYYQYSKIRYVVIGILVFCFVYSPLFEVVIIGANSELKLLSKFNYTLVSISYILLFLKVHQLHKKVQIKYD